MDNPTDLKEVELREVDKKTPLERNNKEPQQLIVDELPSIPLKEIAQKVVEKINCRKHFGIYGLLCYGTCEHYHHEYLFAWEW